MNFSNTSKMIKGIPETVQTLQGPRPVNISDWMDPALVAYFGAPEVARACELLDFVLNDFQAVCSLSENQKSPIPYIHSWTEKKYITRGTGCNAVTVEEKTYHGYTRSTIPSSRILQACLLERFPALKRFTRKEQREVKPYGFVNGFLRLADIPESLRGLTVVEILNLDVNKTIIEETTAPALLCYATGGFNPDSLVFLETDIILNGGKQCLYIPLRALENSDYSLIHTTTENYLRNYYKNSPYLEQALKVLTCETAQRLRGLLC